MVTQNGLDGPSPLFAQMLREKPGRALAWLRAADYMPDDEERRYCLEHAVLIDPTDATAQSLLLALKQSCSEPKHPTVPKGWLVLRHLRCVFGTTINFYRNPARGAAK